MRRVRFDPVLDALVRFARRAGDGISDRQRRDRDKNDEDLESVEAADVALGDGMPSTSGSSTPSSQGAANGTTPEHEGIAGRIEPPVWSSGKSGSVAETALDHANRHGADVGSLNALDYVARAQQFLRHPPSTALVGRRQNGATVVYDPDSDLFGVLASDGTPQTVFRPDPALHPYDDNLAYFHANIQELLP